MKKIFTFLIVSFLAYNSIAQITISGSVSYPVLNMTFAPVSSVPLTDCYISAIDAGTNAYKATVIFPPVGMTPGYTINYYISRRNNYWHIEGFSSFQAPHQYYIYYVSQSTSTDINPPCNVVWKIYTGYCVPSYGFSIADTGTTTSTLLLSGTCVSVPMISTTICPNVLLLPQQTTAQILSIPSPQKGMIVFDVSTNTIKIYNGAAWKTISVF